MLPSPVTGEGGHHDQTEKQGHCGASGGSARAVRAPVQVAVGRAWLYAVDAGQPVAGDGAPEQMAAGASARRGRPERLSLIHISEPTRRTPISYAVFCLKKKNNK